jgi:hypothetical protein
LEFLSLEFVSNFVLRISDFLRVGPRADLIDRKENTMNGEMKRGRVWKRPAALTLILLLPFLLYLAGCGGGSGNSGAVRIVTADVSAAAGGTFSDDPLQPTFTLTIPPGALSTDAALTVDVLGFAPGAGPNQTSASRAFLVSLSGVGIFLSEPMQLEMLAAPLPVHPQIGEIAVFRGNVWERLSANFFRPSDNTVVALTMETGGTFQVVHRTLQRTAGPAVAAGFDVFLNETFGNENFFGDVVGLHTILNVVAPSAAVALGAQVDLAKVPVDIVNVMTGPNPAAKDDALADPAVTRQLIKAGAVIGVKGFYQTPDPADDVMIRAGISCALCHVNVTPTEFLLGAGPTLLPIGPMQVDGVPNTRMDAGAILALTPFAQAAGQPTIDLLNSWGPGAFDVRALPDNPLDDGVNNPTSNPPIWNFVDLEEQEYLFGWDGLFQNDGINNNALASQAEAVYDLVMHANGAFGIPPFAGPPTGNLSPELRIAPPLELVQALEAAEAGDPGNDIITQDLLDVQAWMRSLVSPAPGPFDEVPAEEGFKLFHGRAGCVSCHQTAEFTGPGLFTDITLAPPAGDLSGGIRVPGLRGISLTAPYFHDHSALTLEDAVARFVARGDPVPLLSPAEQSALVEYLKSL